MSRLAQSTGVRLLSLLLVVLASVASGKDASSHGRGGSKIPELPEPGLTPAELSNVVGWISIACWVVVYSPQIYENYQCKSGEGLSITFVIIWLLGDAMNMIGAVRQGLLSTMIILAGYYCLCDFALIFQYYYYRKHHDYFHPPPVPHPHPHPHQHHLSRARSTERTPLLANGDSVNGGSHARSSSRASHRSLQPVVPPNIHKKKHSIKAEVLRYTLALLMIAGVGVFAWYVSARGHNHDSGSGHAPSKGPHHGHRHRKDGGPGEGSQWKWDAQIFGWCSAVLYLSSRIPQIFKNRLTKCEGLSLALFLFAVGGNATYVASILLRSTERDYLLENASWLVGSIGTIFLDFVVLGQFVVYKQERDELREMAETGELYCEQDA